MTQFIISVDLLMLHNVVNAIAFYVLSQTDKLPDCSVEFEMDNPGPKAKKSPFQYAELSKDFIQ